MNNSFEPISSSNSNPSENRSNTPSCASSETTPIEKTSNSSDDQVSELTTEQMLNALGDRFSFRIESKQGGLIVQPEEDGDDNANLPSGMSYWIEVVGRNHTEEAVLSAAYKMFIAPDRQRIAELERQLSELSAERDALAQKYVIWDITDPDHLVRKSMPLSAESANRLRDQWEPIGSNYAIWPEDPLAAPATTEGGVS